MSTAKPTADFMDIADQRELRKTRHHLASRREARRRLQGALPNMQRSADLQLELAGRLLSHLDGVRLNPQRALFMGIAPQQWFKDLQALYPESRAIIGAHASAYLSQVRGRWPWRRLPATAVYGTALPFADASFGLLVNHLLGSRLQDLDSTISEAARVLQPGGLFAASLLGPDSFIEWRDAWAAFDGGVHVADFADMHEAGDMLGSHGFADVVVDAERLTLTYASLQDAVAESRRLAIANIEPQRAEGLTGRVQWRRFDDNCTREDGRVRITLELAYVHAWRAESGRRVDVQLS